MGPRAPTHTDQTCGMLTRVSGSYLTLMVLCAFQRRDKDKDGPACTCYGSSVAAAPGRGAADIAHDRRGAGPKLVGDWSIGSIALDADGAAQPRVVVRCEVGHVGQAVRRVVSVCDGIFGS